MKKLFGLLVVVGLFAFTACGGAKKTDDAAANPDSAATTAPAHDASSTPAEPAPADTAKKADEHKAEGDHGKDAKAGDHGKDAKAGDHGKGH